MGKGDKKTRRGKIILGTFGARRRRKKEGKPEIKPETATRIPEVKEKKKAKEKAEIKEVSAVAEARESKASNEKATPRAPKAAKEKKEIAGGEGEVKSKKEKKA